MEFLFQLAILIGVAKILGELCERSKLPVIIGYISTGILLGPLVLHLLEPKPLEVFAELGAILLLFIIGFEETSMEELLKQKKGAFTVSLIGYACPFIFAFFAAKSFGLTEAQSLLLAVSVAATSVDATVKTLIDLGKINSRMGKTILGATVVDGIMGLVIFTGVLTYAKFGGAAGIEILYTVGSILFFVLIFLASQAIIPRIIKFSESLEVEEAQFSIAFILMIVLAYFAETFGLEGIVGAMLAGMIVSKSNVGARGFNSRIKFISFGIFVPIFFAWSGLLVTSPQFSVFSITIVAGVLIVNFLGAALGAKLGGLSQTESIGLGLGVLPRGGINLVIVSIAKNTGLLPGETGELIFSTTMLLFLVSVLMTPINLRAYLGNKKLP